MNMDTHTVGLEVVSQRATFGQHCMDLVPILREAAKDTLHAAGGPINISRIIDRKNLHVLQKVTRFVVRLL